MAHSLMQQYTVSHKTRTLRYQLWLRYGYGMLLSPWYQDGLEVPPTVWGWQDISHYSLPSAHPFLLVYSSIPYTYLYYPSKILWTKNGNQLDWRKTLKMTLKSRLVKISAQHLPQHWFQPIEKAPVLKVLKLTFVSKMAKILMLIPLPARQDSGANASDKHAGF